jgi:hypothetical protein
LKTGKEEESSTCLSYTNHRWTKFDIKYCFMERRKSRIRIMSFCNPQWNDNQLSCAIWLEEHNTIYEILLPKCWTSDLSILDLTINFLWRKRKNIVKGDVDAVSKIPAMKCLQG